MLHQVVEAWHQGRLRAVAGGFGNGVEVDGQHLAVAVAIDGKERTAQAAKVHAVVQTYESAHPGQTHLGGKAYGVAAAQPYALPLVGGEALGALFAQTRSEGLVVVGRHRVHRRIEGAQHIEAAVDQTLGNAVELQDALVLLKQYVGTRRSGTGQQHDEGHLAVARCHDGGYHSALAVANDAHALGVDFFLFAQEVESGLGVVGKIERRGILHFALRAAGAAVVAAQHGDAVASQVVGQHEEGLVAQQLLVAVLLAAATDKDHRREGTRAVGKGQRPGQRDTCFLAFYHHLLFGIWERRLGRLRTHDAEDGVGREKMHLCAHRALAESAAKTAVGSIPDKHKAHTRRLVVDAQRVADKAPFRCRNGIGRLHRAVQNRLRIAECEIDGQRGLLEYSQPPTAFELRHRAGLGHCHGELRKQGKSKGYLLHCCLHFIVSTR